MMEKYNYRKDPHQDIDHVFRDLLPAHGMVERPAQVELSHQMLDAMLNGSIALCDAGTGIGKTYAYLVAGVVFRRYRSRAGLPNQPLLISTSSIALQGAIIHDYLPFLSKVMMADGMLDSPLRAVLRKGKSHYVCDARLMKRLQTANLDRKNPLAKAALLSMRDHLDLDMAPHLSGYDRERICVPPTCDCGKTECRYLEGLSYQKLADLLNQEHIPFSKEVPVWDKHKVKRLLENPRYTGQNGYPGILDTETFQCVQSRIQEKTAKQTPKAERQILKLADRLHCASCGSTLYRMGGKNHRKDTLYLKCAHCGITITIQDEILLEEVIHQMEEWDRPEQTSYQPSGEVIRLTNAINRGLEHPDDPQEVISLILQGVAARYACCPDTQEHTNRPLDVCWDHIRLAVSHINISEENTVKVTFQQEHRERTEHGTDSTEAGTDHTGNEKC